MHDMLLAAFVESLPARDARSLLIDVELSGRDGLEAFADERLVGAMQAHLPVLLTAYGDQAGLLLQLGKQLEHARERAAGFGRLRHILRDPRFARSGESALAFCYHDRPTHERLANLACVVEHPADHARVPGLRVDCWLFDDRLHVRARSDVLSAGVLEGLTSAIVEGAELAARQAPPQMPSAIRGSIAALTPIQRQSLEMLGKDFEGHVVISAWDCASSVEHAQIERALQLAVRRHEALRMRLRAADGDWHQEVVPVSELEITSLCTPIDLSGQSEHVAERMAREAIERLRDSVRASEAPLLRAALLQLGEDRPAMLLLAVHHLAIDPVSWGALMVDMESWCRLPLQPDFAVCCDDSFREWACVLDEYSRSSRIDDDRTFWLGQAWQRVRALPRRELSGPAATAGGLLGHTFVLLPEAETKALTRLAWRESGGRIDEFLLAALASALRVRAGQDACFIEMMHHGRADVFPQDMLGARDLSRTIGWFSTGVPVVVDLAGMTDVQSQVQAVREQLAQQFPRTIGYNLLRHGQPTDRLACAPLPEIRLNHHGRADAVTGTMFRARKDQERLVEILRTGKLRRSLDILTQIVDGQLHVHLTFDEAVHDPGLVRQIAEHLIASLHDIAVSKRVFADAPGATSVTGVATVA